jgi:hypothetical protein
MGFCAGTTVFEEALNAVKFLGWLKKFGPAQNILGSVKGQGIHANNLFVWHKMFVTGTISHCAFSSNLFHRQIIQKHINQLSQNVLCRSKLFEPAQEI